MDGAHYIERCEVVTSRVLNAVFTALDAHRVLFEGMLLKPNMVIGGMKCARQESVQRIAEATVRCMIRYVPAAVPGIIFLSGGQSIEDPIRYLFQVRARSAQQPITRCRRSRAKPTLKRLRSKAGPTRTKFTRLFEHLFRALESV
jgi:fructose-bisphosphate aldolase class I